MKKIATLYLALRELGLEDSLLSLGSLQRRVDILSYSRKVLNLFFKWLSQKILETEKRWEEIDVVDRYMIMDEPEQGNRFSEIFGDDIFVTISVNKKTGMLEALGGMEGKEGTLVGSLDLTSLKDEEKRIAKKAASYFKFKFLPAFVSDPTFREGGVAFSEGVMGYSVRIDVDASPGYISKKISEVYSRLLELMVHEHTHIQQSVLEEELSDVNPWFIGERYNGDEETNFVELINKNKLNQPHRWEDEDWAEEEESLFVPEISEENLSFEQKLEKAFKLIDRTIRPEESPDLNQKEKERAKGLIQSEGFYSIVSLFDSENYSKYQEEKNEKEESKLIEDVKKYHTTPETAVSRSDIVNYYNKQIEVEAFMRGWRATLSSSGGKKNFAQHFKTKFRRIPEKDMPREELAKLWNKFKDTYKKMNYPEKYLGTDEQALLSDREYEEAKRMKRFLF